MRYIVIDTSSIIFGLSNGKDAFKAANESADGYVPIISKGIINELKEISERGSKFSKFANTALLLIIEWRIDIVNNQSAVDDWIAEAAKKEGYAVCTNDMELKRALKKARIRVFSITRSGLLR